MKCRIFDIVSVFHCLPKYGLGEILDWLQSLKQFFINVSYHIHCTCSQSNSEGSVIRSLMTHRFKGLKTEPSELDWLQVYNMTH